MLDSTVMDWRRELYLGGHVEMCLGYLLGGEGW